MSNFRHPHILTLLGISFDFNMSFIIMELMEDGDLLSVLRSCRNSSVMPLMSLTQIESSQFKTSKIITTLLPFHRSIKNTADKLRFTPLRFALGGRSPSR